MKKMHPLATCALAAAIAFTALPLHAQTPPSTTTAPEYKPDETKAQRDARLQWWREARFGMFIHWGIYSVPAGVYQGKQIKHIGEWIMNDAKIPVAEYAAYAKQFNPTQFNADQWVGIAKNAGMKYIVITSKHHDGFAMFHTKVDDYNIYDASPWKHDPIAELSKAATAQGMKFGLYYSQCQDWHHPGGAALHGGHWDKAQDGDYDQYLQNVALPQVKEILNNYGNIAELWWDTPVDMTPARYAPFLEEVNRHPNLIMNDRLVKERGPIGDFSTPEQYIPATGLPGKDWETCMTMNDTWGYKSWDENWKSTTTLLHNLIDAASKGGNYLLNVGPDATGTIPAASVERLAEIGTWMKTNGDAIYGTSASPFRLQPWGRCTKKVDGDKTTLYLHVFNWPADGKLSVPIKNTPVKTYLLADPQRTFNVSTTAEDGAVIALTGAAPDPIASVVVMEIQGTPDVVPHVVRAEADGSIHLTAFAADVDGLRFSDAQQLGTVPPRLASWKEPNHAQWQVNLPAGDYDVLLNASSAADAALTLHVGDQTLNLTAPGTGAASKAFKFKTNTLGHLTIPTAGHATLTLSPKGSNSKSDLSVHELILQPKKPA